MTKVHPRNAPLARETPMPCAEDGCGGTLRRKWSNRFNRYWYGCDRWPSCKGTIGCHPDGRPLGTPASTAVKQLRIEAHAAFDVMWKDGPDQGRGQRRGRAYAWLAKQMGLEAVHMAELDAEGCRRVIEIMKAREASAGAA